MKKSNIQVGDLVAVKNWDSIKGGIVTATDKFWFVIKDHFEVNGCIVSKDDITKIIHKQLIPKKYYKYIKG